MNEFRHKDPDGDTLCVDIRPGHDPERLVGVLATDSRDGQCAAVHLNRGAVKKLRKILKRALKEAR